MIYPILLLMENKALKTAFLELVNRSIAASWLVLAVLVVRLLLKKAPKWVNVLLWGIVAVRLLCPFTIESTLSLIPSTQTIPMNIEMAASPAIDSGVSAVNRVVNPMITASFTPHPGASANPLQIWIPLAAVIWLFGMAAMLLYTTVSYWRLNRRIGTAIRCRENIYQSENVSSPFVLGIFRPKIYLPFHMNEQELRHVVAHERAHIRRKDHWWKPLGFFLLTVHWFNPALWLAYALLCRDIELACDEKVIKELSSDQRADYTQALVACSVNRRIIAACPLAFGEVSVKDRVKSVMNYKKPAFWMVTVAVLACGIVAVCFLTNPVNREPDLSFLNYENAISIVSDQEEVMAIYCPSSDTGSGSSIQMGAATGSDLAKQLDRWDWKECSAPNTTLPSPGSVEFIIEEDYRITVHQRKSGSLRQYAVVNYQEDVCYYSIHKSDYPDAVALVHTPRKITERGVTGKIYRYEKEGLLGEFRITLFDDGTFSYYEGMASSYFGTGAWQQDGRILTLRDDETVGYGLVNRFYLEGDSLVYIEKDSSNFIYVKVADGEHFDLIDEFLKQEGSDEMTSVSGDVWDRIPMVMVNGTLYLDTGLESEAMERTDHVDGEITSQVDSSKEPIVNDQSNFGTGYIYQFGKTEGTVDLLIDGRWWIFATEEARQGLQFPSAEEPSGFYLTVGSDGVKCIELAMAHSSGGCENADGSLYKKGDRVWLENLEGYKDLRGLTVTALGEQGEVIWTASIPGGEENKGCTHIKIDGWEITNIK